MEWGDSDAKEIENGEKVQLRSFSTSNHRVDTLVSYRYVTMPALGCELLENGTYCATGLQIEKSQENSGGFELCRDQIFRLIEQVLWTIFSQI